MSLSADLQFFAKFIETELGIVYAEHNYFQLQNRLEEIARAVGASSISQLSDQARVEITGALRQLLLDSATNNETSFFRDPKIFQALKTVVIPTLVADPNFDKNIRVWSAASSTGQEAISLSLVFEDWCEKRPEALINFKIVATDISERVLKKARSGIYTQLEVQRGLSALQIVNHFKKVGEAEWQANENIAKRISFQSLNLKSPIRFDTKFHIVFLRNVLIYQGVESKIDILSRVGDWLLPNGYLVLGSGESLIGLSNDYDSRIVDGAVIYKRKGQSEVKAA